MRGKKQFKQALSFSILLAVCPMARAASYSSTILFPISVGAGFSAPYAAGPASAVNGQVVGSATATGAGDHAFLWSPSATSGVDLVSGLGSAVVKSYAVATDGVQQIGYTEGSGGAYTDQAMLWSNSAGSVVNLNPTDLSGIAASEATAIAQGQQVGYGEGSTSGLPSHALLWTGSASSAVDLNPAFLGFTTSEALGTDGTRQVGEGSGTITLSDPHALLWSSTAGSAVDLNPANLGIISSFACGICGNQEVGYGSGLGAHSAAHALLWINTAASAVDLNPTDLVGFSTTQATGTNGSQQVGYGFDTAAGNLSHALLWSSTAASAVDLQSLLPSAGTWTASYASSIDNSGNVFGVAQGTFNNFTGSFAVEWSPSAGSTRTDIGSGSLDLPNASLTTETALVHQGYNNGAWNGSNGIISSAAANDTAHLTAIGVIQNNQGGSPIYSSVNPFEGQSPAATDILLKYTYYGDTNLDGKVDGSDYSRIDNAYLSNNALTGWFNGDFNYDGVVDGSDYTLIDNAYNSQGAQLTAALSTAQIASTASVPGPTSLSLAIAPALILFRRRRHDRRPSATSPPPTVLG
jgi:hypothetical protein